MKKVFEQSKPLIGQTIIYYPFKFTKSFLPKLNNKKIFAEKISNDNQNYIYYDNFIKFVDTECNNRQNKFSRSVYTIGINFNLNNESIKLEKGIYCPETYKNNLKINEFNEFVNLFLNRIINNRNNSVKENKIDLNFINLNIPILSKANIILYNKTNIGFLELYINYEFYNDDLVNNSKLISIDTGTLKKIFYLDNNKKDYKKRFEDDINDKKAISDSLNIVSNFINSLDINENFNVKPNDIIFNCIDYKKRAYSYSYIFVQNDKYKKIIKELNKKQNDSIMLYLGRGHSIDDRELNPEIVEKFLYEDTNSATYGITNSGFGALVRYTNKENFNYYMQHLDEQFTFLYEYCLHLRFYLYTVIENYRDVYINYDKVKNDFAEKITRYNLSLVSEVEPQDIYVKIREAMNLDKIVDDAKSSLELLDAKQDSRKNKLIEFFSFCLTIVGIFGMITTCSDWYNTVFDSFNNVVNYNVLNYTILFAIICVVALMIIYDLPRIIIHFINSIINKFKR